MVSTIQQRLNQKIYKDILGITLGTMLCGLGFALFLIPFKSSPGGVGGLSQLFYHLLGMPAGISMLIFNIPLFIIGLRSFGRSFGAKTVYGMVTTSLFTDIFSPSLLNNFDSMKGFLFEISPQIYALTNEPFLAVVTGSVIVGAGFGFVIKFNGSTGGTDIPALLMRKHFGLTIGSSYLIIDSIIITLIGVVFKDPNLLLWGMLSLYLSSKVCDFIIEGYSQAKGVFIISDRSDSIKEGVMGELNRGCTIFIGEGGFSQNSKSIIYTVINRSELMRLKSIVKGVDRDAFVTVNDVHQAVGSGFRKDFE